MPDTSPSDIFPAGEGASAIVKPDEVRPTAWGGWLSKGGWGAPDDDASHFLANQFEFVRHDQGSVSSPATRKLTIYLGPSLKAQVGVADTSWVTAPHRLGAPGVLDAVRGTDAPAAVGARAAPKLAEREARIVGIKNVSTPTLEAVDRRRSQLWTLAFSGLVCLATAVALLTSGVGHHLGFASRSGFRVGTVLLVVALAGYVMEKERHLRRLAHLLLDERVAAAGLSDRLKKVAMLHEAGRAMNSDLVIDDVLQLILTSAFELLEGSSGSIMLIEEPDTLVVVCELGNSSVRGALIKLGEGIAGQVASERKPLLIAGSVSKRGDYKVGSTVCAPLLHRGRLLGVLSLNNTPDRVFSEHDLRAVSMFAEHAAIAVANHSDITARKEAEDDLRAAHERFRSAFENAPIGMGMRDLEGRIIQTNPAYGKILGRRPEDLVGMSVNDLTHPDDREWSAAEMRNFVSSGSDSYQIEKRYIHSDGDEVWVSLSISCVRDEENRPLYLIGQAEDITERREMRERLAYAAIHDPLTGLPNRALFMDRLEVALRRASRGRQTVAVIFLDLDRFKLVNDSLGHEVGDQVLCAVAERLSGVVRASDTLARFGGDEFTVLCDDVDGSGDAFEAAQRLVLAMGQPLALPSGEVFVSLSVGVALSSDGEPGAVLLRNADVAMYRAKERGPSRIEIYRADDEQNVVSRLRTSNELHRALERHELELHYQPFVDLHTETFVGMEALVRWQHPTRGLLLPQEFIPLAEDSGLIVPLGAWVLNEACRQTAAWNALRTEASQDEARLNISINVSAVQLAESGFPDQVAEAIEASGINPDRLWLEITESALMRDADDAVVVLRALRDLGIHLEIDDFGTGYSSLSYLQRFPVETLKIDRSFVEDLDQRSDNAAIVRAIIGLGDSLGIPIIAEGVERPAQVARLQALGCHLAQGYLFGRPLPARLLGTFPTDDLSSWNQLRESAVS